MHDAARGSRPPGAIPLEARPTGARRAGARPIEAALLYRPLLYRSLLCRPLLGRGTVRYSAAVCGIWVCGLFLTVQQAAAFPASDASNPSVVPPASAAAPDASDASALAHQLQLLGPYGRSVAPGWTFTPSITLQEVLNDNVFQSETDGG